MRSKQRQAVVKALFEGRKTEAQICDQYGLSEQTLSRHLMSAPFLKEFRRLREEAVRNTELMLARFGPMAAVRLAELIDSDKPDVARRAALDLIDRCLQIQREIKESHSEPGQSDVPLSDDQARQMVLRLADGLTEKDEEEEAYTDE